MNKYYVYIHIQGSRVFYVGKGHGSRAWSSKNRNQYWKNVAKDGFEVQIVESNLSETSAFSLEKVLIVKYRPSLTNMTEGGEGRSNYKWTLEQIQKRTQSVLGKPRSNKGFKWSESQKSSLSKALTGKIHKDSKTVLDVSTGKLYRNAKVASLELGLPWGSVYKMLSGVRINTTTLKYLEK